MIGTQHFYCTFQLGFAPLYRTRGIEVDVLFQVLVDFLTSCLEPLYGIVLAVIFLREIPSQRVLIGGIIILITVSIVTVRKQN